VAGRAGDAPSYVALGDSYAAGPGISPQLDDPVGCDRSGRDYPHLVAEALGLRLTDMTCGGATSGDLTAAQVVAGGVNPPQLDGVNRRTAVVTITIGGNDLGFSSLIRNCVALTPVGPTLAGLSCRSHYDPGGTDSLTAPMARAAAGLGNAIELVHMAAPDARVFVVGYPAILPLSGDGCWPQLPFTLGDVGYLRSVEEGLNSTVARVAAANGAAFVDTYRASAAHTACGPAASRWVEPLWPNGAAPVHPNATGEAALAALVTAAIRTDRLL
jgi:lysophospholipase L1-like esterase